MSDLGDRLRSVAGDVLDGTPVAFAYLFGSQVGGDTTSRSDVDVAVHLGAEPSDGIDQLGLRLRLADALERAVGVGPVEVVVLDDAPLSLRGRVQEQQELIYSADEAARVRYESLTARMYHDFKLREERSARERLEHLAGGA